MDKKVIKNLVTIFIVIVISPMLLFGLTYLGNAIAKKGEVKQVEKVENKDNENKDKAKKEEDVDKETEEEKYKEEKDKELEEAKKQEETKKEQTEADLKQVENKEKQDVKKEEKEPKKQGNKEYVVKSGDTLYQIALEKYGDKNAMAGVEKIKSANNISTDNLQIGEKLTIPE